MGKFAMSIIISAVVILLALNFFYAQGVSAGLVTGLPYGGTTNTCSTVDQFFISNGTGSNVVCDALHGQTTLACNSNAATRCNFTSIQFLDPSSFVSCMIKLSFQCAINTLNGLNNVQPAPFTYFNFNTNPIYVTCLNVNGSGIGTSQGNTQIENCNQDFVNGSSVPFSKSYLYGAPAAPNIAGTQYNCTTWFTLATFGTGSQYQGCIFVHTGGAPNIVSPANNNKTFGFIKAMNQTTFGLWSQAVDGGHSFPFPSVDAQGTAIILTNNASATNAYHCILQLATSNPTPECQAWFNAGTKQNSQTENASFGIALALGFIGAFIVFIIGMGLSLNVGIFTNTFGIAANSQGTRFFQTLGFALLIWIPVLGATTNAINSIGLGLGGILDGILTFMLVVGIMTQTLNIL